MNEILSLAPQNVWKHFYSLTQIPRPSGHLEKIQAFLLEFGKQVGVESFQHKVTHITFHGCVLMPFLRTGIVKETLFLVKNTSAEIAMIFTEVLSLCSIIISQHKLLNNIICKAIL